METIEGYVEKITFRNEENGYTVLRLSAEGGEECLVGVFPSISEGEYIEATGERILHPTYGPQIKVSAYKFIAPDDAASMERYLSSGAVKGIGERLAKRIVAKFGDETFRIMEEEPERLQEVKGISLRIAMAIAEQIVSKRETRNAMIFLQQYGISLSLAARIFEAYGENLYRVLREDPYRLAEDVRGVGFKTADEIAARMNIARDSEKRIRAAALYALQEAAGNGHMYLPKDLLILETEKLLAVGIGDFDHLLQDLAIERKIKRVQKGQEERVYLYHFYLTEEQIALRLKELNLRETGEDEEALKAKIRRVEKAQGVSLDDLQRKAILTAATNGVTIMTGGPGTGKTTTIHVMIEFFLKEGLDVLLAAPTGRAAKRMTEATGYEAATIHRLLEASGNPEDDGVSMRFQRDEDNPLDADVIIIDEMSMVDEFLMLSLLRALVAGQRLVLSGDADQLPSVGPGEVLRDLIRSNCFPVVKFEHIFRQSAESDIIVNAHKINAGEIVEKKYSKDFLFVERNVPGEIVGATVTLLRDKLPKYVHADTKDLQVLCPMKRGTLGVETLNKLLQQEFNPPREGVREKEYADTVFREGDKVMHVRNDYDLTWEIEDTMPSVTGKGVFNGEIGFIRSISFFEETMTVVYDDHKVVVYPFRSLDELELAYAVTIHKSQGSEYPAVVLPLLSGPDLLMTRNLLYTGVTRARTCVTIVGSYDTFLRMIRNDRKTRRYTGLSELIQNLHEFH